MLENFDQSWRNAVAKAIEANQRFPEETICKVILNAGAVTIRDVDAGKALFSYTSGNRGPGYIDIKGLVGQEEVFKFLVRQEALKLMDSRIAFDFIAANATGGMIPGYQLREDLQQLTGRSIPYVYVRNSRKPEGHKELVTGISRNPHINPGSKALIVEELINFSQTTTHSALGFRELGYQANSAATLLHYQNPEALRVLGENGITVVSLTSLPTLFEAAQAGEYFSRRAIADYKAFLQDPLTWQRQRGLEPISND